MRYRKIVLILMAGMLAGCTADNSDNTGPVSSEAAVGFKANVVDMQDATRAGMQHATRATGVITDKTELAENGFGVFCLYNTTTIMDNVQITSPDEGNTWTYSPVRYWPGNKQYLSFFTYAPYIPKSTATDVTEDAPLRVMYNDDGTFAGKIQMFMSNDPAKQHDLLYGTTSDGYALTHWKYDKDGTEKTTGNDEKTTTTGGITSYFHHATAKFKMFINHNFDKVETSNQRIFIRSVELKNVPQKGELDIMNSNVTPTTTGETTTTSITPVWSNVSGNQDIVLTENNLNSAIVYTGAFSSQGVLQNKNSVLPTSDDYLLLLPKDNPNVSDPVEIAVTYIPLSRNKKGQIIDGPAVTVHKTLTKSIEGNKSYTLNITLGANTTFTLDTQPWDANDVTQDANDSKMFDIPSDGYLTWKYTEPKESETGEAIPTDGYSYSLISSDGTVVTDPLFDNKTECTFQINSISGKKITCKAELLECSSDGLSLTGNPSSAFAFEDNSSQTMKITPGIKSYLKIKYTGDRKSAAYARLRITVTYNGKNYIVYSLTEDNTFTEYTLYHTAEYNATGGQQQ